MDTGSSVQVERRTQRHVLSASFNTDLQPMASALMVETFSLALASASRIAAARDARRLNPESWSAPAERERDQSDQRGSLQLEGVPHGVPLRTHL